MTYLPHSHVAGSLFPRLLRKVTSNSLSILMYRIIAPRLLPSTSVRHRLKTYRPKTFGSSVQYVQAHSVQFDWMLTLTQP